MIKILLAGESWISTTTEYKGYDSFTNTKLEIGCTDLLKEFENLNYQVTHILAHDVPEKFPWSIDELNQYDVVILSDIGSNSLTLSQKVFDSGQPTINRMELLKDWVMDGGSLMMAGGYLSFGGFEGKGHYHHTPIEDVLPVNVLPYDDRIEVPDGRIPQTSKANSISSDLGEFPPVLGYQETLVKENSQVLMTIDKTPLLVIGKSGKGRSLVYTSDIAPHWASQEFMSWSHYGEFFSRCIRWLAKDLEV